MSNTTTNKPCVLFAKYAVWASMLLCATNASTEEYQHSYPVSGSNMQEVLEQIRMNSNSPEGAFGHTQLNTHIGWTANVQPNGVCEVASVEFSYDITISMPDWLEKNTAKQCLQDNWDTAWQAVQLHEERHRELYRLINIDEIEQIISALQPQASCELLTTAVNHVVNKALEANDKLHDAFHASNTPTTLWDC